MSKLQEWRKYVDKRIENIKKKEEQAAPDEGQEVSFSKMPHQIADTIQFLSQKDKRQSKGPRGGVLTPIIDPIEILIQKDKKPARKMEEKFLNLPGQKELPLGIIKPPAEILSMKILDERKKIIEKLLDPEVTLQEAAILLTISRATLRRYSDKGLISCIKTPTGQRKFKLSSLLEFQEKRGRLNLPHLMDIDEADIFSDEEKESEQTSIT